MSGHNFKSITVVPTAKDFNDIVLSNTQRKTPTVVHPQYRIGRIRQFYTRKVKHTQQVYHDKLTTILTDFPVVSDLSPFYSDLTNILYDKDHYKIGLADINAARHSIDNVAKEYTRLLKYADSLYRCKCLKRAALGKMAKVISQKKQTFVYLEEVRQHMSRLPSIDPSARTLLLTGYPNVGKSSFINKVTRADVEVHSYPNTTRSLFVGHMDYKYLRWQVIDSPGLSEKPLRDCNDIEMQSIVALSHIRCAVLYFMDPSEQCGYSIEQQIELFQSLRQVFGGKPLFICCNKADVIKRSELPKEKQDLFKVFEEENIMVMDLSTMSEEGITEVKTTACNSLLTRRTEMKMKSGKVNDNDSRLRVSQPVKRDTRARPPCIPESVLRKRQRMQVDAERKLERDIELEEGDEYILDLKKHYDLPNPEEKYDVIPEIVNGKNIADFIDPDIQKKLAKLEEEEARRERAGFYDSDKEEETQDMKDLRKLARRIREKRTLITLESREKRRIEKPRLPRTAKKVNLDDVEKTMGDLGVDIDTKDETTHLARGRSRSEVRVSGRETRKRKREASQSAARSRSMSRVTPRDKSGVRDPEMATKVRKIAKKAQKPKNQDARKGEADRHIFDLKPKHLFAGKRKMGKTDRR